MADTGWMIQAIEKAAERRAMDILVCNPENNFRIFGLSPGQVAHLRRYYEKRTNKLASEITSKTIDE